MKIVTYLILGLLIYGIFRTKNNVQASTSSQERAFIIRTTAAFWLVGFLLFGALLVVPNKARVLMALPVFFLAVSGTRAWQNSRERLRRKESQKIDIEKMKRVN